MIGGVDAGTRPRYHLTRPREPWRSMPAPQLAGGAGQSHRSRRTTCATATGCSTRRTTTTVATRSVFDPQSTSACPSKRKGQCETTPPTVRIDSVTRCRTTRPRHLVRLRRQCPSSVPERRPNTYTRPLTHWTSKPAWRIGLCWEVSPNRTCSRSPRGWMEEWWGLTASASLGLAWRSSRTFPSRPEELDSGCSRPLSQVGDKCDPVCSDAQNRYNASKEGAGEGVMYFYEGSTLPLEWTTQHSCGPESMGPNVRGLPFPRSSGAQRGVPGHRSSKR